MTVSDSAHTDKSAEEPPQGTKPCRVCGEGIPVPASFCTECEHYQDWRRYVTFSTTMVALLTALISVVASSAPTIRSMWRGAYTGITVSEQGLVGTELLFFAANSGTRDGGIASLHITGPLPGFSFSLQPVEPASTFIRAGSSSQIRLIATRKLRMSFANLSEALRGGSSCKIHMTIIDFRGTRTPWEAQHTCTTLLPFLNRQREDP